MENADAAAIGLSNFISKCSSPTGREHLNSYCTANPQCTDIFSTLEKSDAQSQLTPKEINLAFEALECVLLYTASLSNDALSGVAGASALRTVGQNVVTKLLQSHMKVVYHSLNNAAPTYLVRRCLKLLCAVCTQGKESARQLIGTLDLGFKPLAQLPARKDARHPDDIRTAFVKLCVALLLYGDADVVKTAMESKVLLSSLFKLLPTDRPMLVHMVLSSLLDKVLKNSAVSKKSKVEFFSSGALLLVAKLCLRSDNIKSHGGANAISIAGLAAGFLHTVCCSTNHGIGFATKYSPSGETNNPLLLRFLTSVHTVGRNELLNDLVVSILSSYPDLLHNYWSGSTFSLEPRPSHMWLGNVKLAIKILESVECPPVAMVAAPTTVAEVTSATAIFTDASAVSVHDAPLQECAVAPSALLSTLIPSSVTSSTLGPGLQHSNWHVKLHTLRLQALALRRTERLIAWCRGVCSGREMSQHLKHISSAELNRLAEYVHDAVTQVMPNINVLTALCQHLLNDFNVAPSPTALHLDGGDGEDSVPDVSVSDLLLAVLECLVSYQVLVPACFVQMGYDLRKLLAPPAVASSRGGQELFLSLPPGVQALIFKLLQQSAPSTVPWHSPMPKVTYSPLLVIVKSYLLQLAMSSDDSGDKDADEESGSAAVCVSTAGQLIIKLCQETEVVSEQDVCHLLEAVRQFRQAGLLQKNLLTLAGVLTDILSSLAVDPQQSAQLWSVFLTTEDDQSAPAASTMLAETSVLSVDEILALPASSARLTMPDISSVRETTVSSPLLLLFMQKLASVEPSLRAALVKFLMAYAPLCVTRSSQPKLLCKFVKTFLAGKNLLDANSEKKLLKACRSGSASCPSTPAKMGAMTVVNGDGDEPMDTDEGSRVVNGGEVEMPALNLHFSPGQDNWKEFAQRTLKKQFGHPDGLQYLASQVPIVYQAEATRSSKQLPLDKLHRLVMSHSKLLDTLTAQCSAAAQFSHDDGSVQSGQVRALAEDQVGRRCKGALVSLLLAIVRAGSTGCSEDHVPIILAAYSPQLTPTDCKLLELLQLYQERSVPLGTMRLCLWGESALSYLQEQSAQSDDGQGAMRSLWNEGCLDRVLQRLDRTALMQSILHVPLELSLTGENSTECVATADGHPVYDPRFLLPLFAESLKPGFVVDCRRFVDSGALSFCLGCLASLQEQTRAGAYLVLELYQHHLESDHTFRDRHHVALLLRNLQYAATEAAMRVPFIIALFLSKAVMQLIHQDHWLYPLINRFLLQRPVLEVADLPLFYNLFNSTALQYKRERNWMIVLLAEGLRHSTDLQLYQRRRVLEIMMTFYLSSTCDNRCKDMVCKLLRQGCQLEPCRRFLLNHLGLLPWLSHAITLTLQGHADQQHLATLISFTTDVLADIVSSPSSLPEPPNVTDYSSTEHHCQGMANHLLTSLQLITATDAMRAKHN